MTEPISLPKKFGFTMRVTDEEIALSEGSAPQGHYETVEWDFGVAEKVREARDLIARVEAHPYIDYDIEGQLLLSPPPRKRWVQDETDEEWLKRWKETR